MTCSFLACPSPRRQVNSPREWPTWAHVERHVADLPHCESIQVRDYCSGRCLILGENLAEFDPPIPGHPHCPSQTVEYRV